MFSKLVDILFLTQICFVVSGGLLVIFDFLILPSKKKFIEKIHCKLNVIANGIRNTPIKKWQLKLANSWLNIFEKGGQYFEKNFRYITKGRTTNRKEWNKKKNKTKQIILSKNKEASKKEIHKLYYAILFVVLPSISLLIYGILLLFKLNIWYLGVFGLPPVIISIIRGLKSIRDIEKSVTITNVDDLTKSTYRFYFFGAFSSYATILAICISIYLIPLELLNTTWFEIDKNQLKPENPIGISIINFIFDFITILITIKLLKIVINRGKGILLAAGVDIILSYILAILMYIFIVYIDVPDLENIPNSIEYANGMFFSFFESLIDGDFSKFRSHSTTNAHIFPLLTTTFFPVIAIMSLLISFSLLKYIMVFFDYLLVVLISKGDKLIAKLGVTFSAFGAITYGLRLFVERFYS